MSDENEVQPPIAPEHSRETVIAEDGTKQPAKSESVLLAEKLQDDPLVALRVDPLDTMRGQIDRLRESLAATKTDIRIELASLRMREPPPVTLSWTDRAIILLCSVMVVTMIGGAFAFFAERPFPTPNVTFTLPEESLPARPVDGYVDENIGALIPWPDNGLVTAEDFERDCDAVCSQPATRFSGDPLPGRTLYCDPEHLVCACYHAGASFPITRYIAWERVP